MSPRSVQRMVLLLALIASPASAAAGKCLSEAFPRETADPVNTWIGKGDWLGPENLRYGFANMQAFMPVIRMAPTAPSGTLKKSQQPLDLHQLTALDPADQKNRSVDFLLGTRLYADGVLVIRNGSILFEDYQHGLMPEQPWLLLTATRPIVAMLAAISTAQGRLRQERALNRLLPGFSSVAELRKISLHSLLNDPAAFQWDETAIRDWKRVSGWEQEDSPEDIRSWMKAANWHLADPKQEGTLHGPEGQLVVWAVEQAWRQKITAVFCERLFAPLRPEYPAYWATDGRGDPLADGLALSLRDFGRMGLALLESRGTYLGPLPNWFAESIASSAGPADGLPPYLAGLEKGSRVRYGFVDLPGRTHRAAAIGAHGNSLFVDFDRRLVIAIFASYPAERSPLMLRTLANVWDAITAAAGKTR